MCLFIDNIGNTRNYTNRLSRASEYNLEANQMRTGCLYTRIFSPFAKQFCGG